MNLGRQTQPYGKLLDYEQFIDHQLARTRTRIKMTDIITAALVLTVAFVATLLAEIVLDHAFGLPLIVRRVVLVVGLTAVFAFTLLRLVLPLVLRINAIYAAKTIENADSTFKNSLVNYLTLRAHRDRLPMAVLATLEARAVSDLAHVEVEQTVNQQHLMKAFYTLCGVAVVFFLYAAFQPKSILDSTKRAFLADVVRPTNTRLLDIKPGDDVVVAGKQVLFSVDTTHGVRPETVKLHYSVDGGKFYAIKEFEPGINYYDPWQLTFNNVQQTMDYYVTGGDAESLHYKLTVLPAPMVTSVKIDYDFPKYTQVAPRKNIEGGNIEAIEDTKVTVHATTNEPASRGTLNLTVGDPAPMTVAADDPHKLTGQFKVTKSGTYTINFRTTGGQLNPNPVVYEIYAIADRPPQAKFLRPDRPTIKVPANVKVDLIMTGWDDHGVKDATLHVNLENASHESLYSKNVLEGRPTAPEFRATEVIDLAQLRVKSGQTLRYWLTVRDNHEPAAHSVQTTAQLIEITDAVAPADKRQIEEKQAKDREQFEQPPPAETEPHQDQVPPAGQQTGEDQPGTDKEQGQPGKNDAEKGGAGNDGQPDQARGTQGRSGGPDQGTATPDAAGHSGQDNPGGQQPPAANDPQLRKLTEGLQKKGLLNPNAGQGNPQPPQSNGAANPQVANPGDGTQQPQNGTQDQNGNAGRQNSPQQNAMPNRSSPAGNSAARPPQPQGSQGGNNSGPQVQPGQQGSDQPRDGAGNPAGANPPQPGIGTQSQGTSGQNSPGNQAGNAGNESVTPGQRDNAQGNMNPQESQAGTQTQRDNAGDRRTEQAKQGGTRTAGKNGPRSDGSTGPAGKAQDSQDTTDPTQKKDRAGNGANLSNRPKDQTSPNSSREPPSSTGSQGENTGNASDAQNGESADNQRSPGETQSTSNQETPGSPAQGDQHASNNPSDDQKDNNNNPSDDQKANNQPRDAADRQGSSTKHQDSATQRGGKQGPLGSNEPERPGSDKPIGGQEKSSSARGSQGSRDDQPAGKKSSEPGTASEGNGGGKIPGQPNAENEMNGKTARGSGNGTKTGQQTDQADPSRGSPNAQAGEPGSDSAQKPSDKSDGSAMNSSQKDATDQPRGSAANSHQTGKSMARDAVRNPAQHSNSAPRRSAETSTRAQDPNAAGRQDQATGNPQKQNQDQAGTPARNPANGQQADQRSSDDSGNKDASGSKSGQDKAAARQVGSQDSANAGMDEKDARTQAPRRDRTQQAQADRQITTSDRATSQDATTSKHKSTTRKTDEEKKTGTGYTNAPGLGKPEQKKAQESTEPEATNLPERQPEPARGQERPRRTVTMPPGESDHSSSASQGPQGTRSDEISATGRQPSRTPGQDGNLPARQGSPGQGTSQNTDGQPEGAGRDESGQISSDGQGKEENSGSPSSVSGGSKSQDAGEESGSGSSSKSGGQSQGQTGNQSGAGTSGEHGSSEATHGQNPSEGTGKGEDSQSQSGNSSQGNQADGTGGAPSQGSSGGQPSQQGEPANQSGSAGESQPAGGQPTGEPGQGDQQGNAGHSPIGGGGRPGSGSTAESAKDDSKPSPHATEPDNPSAGEDIAPPGQSQTEMVLRTVKDLLAKDAVTPDLEKETGMTREQMEQFVKKYENVKSAPAGPGREIFVKPGDHEATDHPSANLPGFGRQERYSTKNQKDRGQVVRDDVQSNLEGISFKPPPEFRSKFEGYRTSLARTRSRASSRSAPAPPAPGR